MKNMKTRLTLNEIQRYINFYIDRKIYISDPRTKKRFTENGIDAEKIIVECDQCIIEWNSLMNEVLKDEK